jgi:hypothetical protein
VGAEAPVGSTSCQYNSLAQSPSSAFPYFFHKLIIFFFTSSSSRFTTINLWSLREGGDGVEEPTAVGVRTKGGRQRRKPLSEEVREGEGAGGQGR